MNTQENSPQFLAQSLDYVKYYLQNFTLTLGESPLSKQEIQSATQIQSPLSKQEIQSPPYQGGLGGIRDQLLTIAFGEEYDRPVATSILTAWENGDFSQIPTIQIIDGSILNGANAGYAIATNTIYVADYFLTNNSQERIAKVLTEEMECDR